MTDRHPADALAPLVEFAKSVDLEELVWEQADRRVAFRRRSGAAAPAPAAVPAASPAAPAVPKLHAVLSPMVGTFSCSPSKDRPPLVVEGDEVTAGERIGVVEAMNIPKDVISDVHGRIVKILVANGRPVEYGQKLFEVDVHPPAAG